MPVRMPVSAPGPSAKAAAASRSLRRRAPNGRAAVSSARTVSLMMSLNRTPAWRTSLSGAGTGSRQRVDRLAAAFEEAAPVVALLLAARLDDAVPVLVEDGEVLRAAPGQRADHRAAQRLGPQRAVPEEVAVQDGVLQHADLLGGGQRRLQPL